MITHLEFITLMNVSNTKKLINPIRYPNNELVYTYCTFHFIFLKQNGLNTVYIWCPKDGDTRGMEVEYLSDLMFFLLASANSSLDMLMLMYFTELQKNVNSIFHNIINKFQENLKDNINFSFHDSNEILKMIKLFFSSTITLQNREFSFTKFNHFNTISKTIHFNVDFSDNILSIEMDNIDNSAYSSIKITPESINVHLIYFRMHYIYSYNRDKHEIIYSLKDENQSDENLQNLNDSEKLLLFLSRNYNILERKFDFYTEYIIDDYDFEYSSIQIQEELSYLKNHIKNINDIMEKSFIQYFIWFLAKF